jgi:hypothetical protein
MGVIVISLGARRSAGETLGAHWNVAEPTRESPTNSERSLGSFGYSFGGLQVLSETLRMYMSNQLPSTANVMHRLLLIITSESY